MQPSNYCLCAQMSATSLQSLGASSTQPGHPSSLLLQNRLQSSLDDGHKASVTLANSTKPLVSPAGQPLVASSSDATSMEKVCLSSISFSSHTAHLVDKFRTFFLIQNFLSSHASSFLQILQSMSSINAPVTVSSSPGSIRPLRGITSTSNFLNHAFCSTDITFTTYICIHIYLFIF